VDNVLASVDVTESNLQHIESRKSLVDEVQLKTNVIVNMLEDVRLNMESLGEHKAVMDHAIANYNRLREMVQESQSALRALQAERELAERIDRGSKQLKARTKTQG
jgi:hypothetical protein